MKKNIYFNYNEKLNIEARARLIKDCGFGGVFLFYSGDLEKEVQVIRMQNLEIETIHLPFKNCNHLWLDTVLGEEYFQNTMNGIIKAWENKIETVVFHISSKDTPPPFNELGLGRLKQFLSLSEKLNINFALENLRRLDYLDYVFKNLKSDKLKFCFDSGHANAFTKNIEFFEFEKYKDKLICVHFHDNFGEFDSHLTPFTGNIDFEKLGNNLKAIDYRGPLTSEAIMGEGMRDLDFLKTNIVALEKIEKFMN